MEENIKEIRVAIDQLFLDPNNLRYIDLTESMGPVPEKKVTVPKVQDKAFERISDHRLEVEQLRDSIRTLGFLTIDRLIVVKLPEPGEKGEERYMVVEGNRRLGAIRSLIKDYEAGEIDIASDILNTFREFPVLLLEEENSERREYIARVLQGVRHVGGIKAWGPYQQAQVVVMMRDEGKEIHEIKETLGISTARINKLRRCFRAIQQMKSDADYGEFARPRMFTHFEEVFRSAKVYKDWLGWDDGNEVFTSEGNRKHFYGWITGEDVEGERQAPKMPESREVRHLPELMDDPVQFKRFVETPGFTLEDALRGIVTPRSRIDWRAILEGNFNALQQLPAADLESATAGDFDLLEKTRELCENHIRFIKSYRKSDNKKVGKPKRTRRKTS